MLMHQQLIIVFSSFLMIKIGFKILNLFSRKVVTFTYFGRSPDFASCKTPSHSYYYSEQWFKDFYKLCSLQLREQFWAYTKFPFNLIQQEIISKPKIGAKLA